MTKTRSKFTFTRANGFIQIEDVGHKIGFATVTNDVEAVLEHIHHQIKLDLTDQRIVYRDSEGRWDGILCKNRGSFDRPEYSHSFVFLDASTFADAVTEYKRKKWLNALNF